MATSATTPIPADMNTITPHLVCAGAAEAIDWYVRALGAVELMRLPAPDGKLMHASLRIGNSTIMLNDEAPEWGAMGPKSLGGSPVTLHYYVENVDAAFQRAVDAGATSKMAPEDMFWGDRYGVLIDPWGHSWSMATHLQDYSPEEIQANMAKMMPECGSAQAAPQHEGVK